MPQPPFQLTRIDHVVLRVADVAAMQRFYCEVLGCQEERRQDEIGLVQLRAGDSLIDLVALDGKLGRLGGAAQVRKGTTWTISACRWKATTRPPSWRT